MNQDLTAAETALNDDYRQGNATSFSSEHPDSVEDSAQWGPDRTLRAEVVAALILNPPPVREDKPPRLVVEGARIVGYLDLGCAQMNAFLFRNCAFDTEPNLNDATGSFVGFTHCLLPGLNAERLRCDGPVWIQHSLIEGGVTLEDSDIADLVAHDLRVDKAARPHSVCLCGAHITHDVDLTSSTLRGAVGMTNIHVGGSLLLARASLAARPREQVVVQAPQSSIGGSVLASPGFEANGCLNFEGAVIGGRIVLEAASLAVANRKSAAIVLDHAEIRLGFAAEGVLVKGMVSMHHASISCQVNLANAKIEGTGDQAIRADHLTVNGSFLLNGTAQVKGSVDFHGAQFECTLNLHALKQSGANEGRGLDLTKVVIKGDVRLTEAHVADGLDLRGGHVAGMLRLYKSVWTEAARRPALALERCTIIGGIAAAELECSGGLSLEHATVLGRIDLRDSKLGGTGIRALNGYSLRLTGDLVCDRMRADACIDLSSSKLSGDLRFADSALRGTPAQAASRGRPLDLLHGGEWRGTALRIAAAEISGGVDLRSAQLGNTLDASDTSIGRTLDLDGASLTGTEGPAINGGRMQARELRIRLAGPAGAPFVLTDASVHVLADAPDSWPAGSDINGLVYAVLAEPGPRSQRLQWIRHIHGTYSPQPYTALAVALRNAGRVDESRSVELASARQAAKSGNGLARTWGLLQDVTIGYGYQPWKALLWAFSVWLLSAAAFSRLGAACGESSAFCATTGDSLVTWDPWLYALDTLLPLMSFGYESAWFATGVGRIIVVAVAAAGWVLLTTIVAAAGRVLRRS